MARKIAYFTFEQSLNETPEGCWLDALARRAQNTPRRPRLYPELYPRAVGFSDGWRLVDGSERHSCREVSRADTPPVPEEVLEHVESVLILDENPPALAQDDADNVGVSVGKTVKDWYDSF